MLANRLSHRPITIGKRLVHDRLRSGVLWRQAPPIDDRRAGRVEVPGRNKLALCGRTAAGRLNDLNRPHVVDHRPARSAHRYHTRCAPEALECVIDVHLKGDPRCAGGYETDATTTLRANPVS